MQQDQFSDGKRPASGRENARFPGFSRGFWRFTLTGTALSYGGQRQDKAAQPVTKPLPND
jgi:hypothetical protein